MSRRLRCFELVDASRAADVESILLFDCAGVEVVKRLAAITGRVTLFGLYCGVISVALFVTALRNTDASWAILTLAVWGAVLAAVGVARDEQGC